MCNAPVGRPSSVTDEVVSKLEDALKMDCTITEACYVSGISRKVYYDYLKHHPEFSDKIEYWRSNPVYTARKTVTETLKTDAPLALKYLERKKRKEFGPKQDINVNVYHTLSDEQLSKRIEQMETKLIEEGIQEAEYEVEGGE